MNSAQADQPLYRPLDASKSEVRVLRLHQGASGEEIKCTLETVSLDDQPIFYALSYVWGSGIECEINVDNYVIPVTPNLATILEHFRRHHHDFLELHSLPLWIDAVCINQASLEERAQQVRLMSRIYSQAARVLLWIGESDEFSDFAFDRLSDETFCVAYADMRTTGRPPTVDEARVDVILSYNLEKRQYWTRVWILQELVLATQDPLMFCGSRRMLWSWYAHCKKGIPTSNLSLTLQRGKISGEVPFHRDFDAESRGSSSHRYLRDGYHDNGPIALIDALLCSADFRATDPRDRVYGVLGLVEAQEMLMVGVDYNKPPEQVFRDAMAALWTSNTQDMIHAWFPMLVRTFGINENVELPSWVLDLSGNNQTELVQGPRYEDGSSPGWRHERLTEFSLEGNIMTIKAIKFDCIAETVSIDLSNLKDYTFFRGKGSGAVDIEPFQLIEAMVLRRLNILIHHSSGLAPFLVLRDKIPVWGALTGWGDGTRLAEDDDPAWRPGVERDGAKLWEILLDRQAIPEAWELALPNESSKDLRSLEDTILSPLLNAIEEKVTGRKVFTTQFGFLGIATKQVEVGDIITLIDGMDLMYMLRPFRDGYRIVGFAEVSGLMNWDDLGEAMKASSLQEEELKIY